MHLSLSVWCIFGYLCDASLVISSGLPWHLKFLITWCCVLFSMYLVVLLACITTFYSYYRQIAWEFTLHYEINDQDNRPCFIALLNKLMCLITRAHRLGHSWGTELPAFCYGDPTSIPVQSKWVLRSTKCPCDSPSPHPTYCFFPLSLSLCWSSVLICWHQHYINSVTDGTVPEDTLEMLCHAGT